MKQVRIRFSDDGTHLITEDQLAEFDRLVDLTQTFSPEIKASENAYEEFNTNFMPYDVEGKLEEIKFYISDKEFDKWCSKT